MWFSWASLGANLEIWALVVSSFKTSSRTVSQTLRWNHFPSWSHLSRSGPRIPQNCSGWGYSPISLKKNKTILTTIFTRKKNPTGSAPGILAGLSSSLIYVKLSGSVYLILCENNRWVLSGNGVRLTISWQRFWLEVYVSAPKQKICVYKFAHSSYYPREHQSNVSFQFFRLHILKSACVVNDQLAWAVNRGPWS